MIYQNKSKEELINALKQIQQKHSALLVLYATSTVEYKLALDALKVSEARYQRLFEIITDRILTQGSETGMIKDVNLFPVDLLDYSKEEIIEKEIREILFLKDIASN